MLPFAKMQACGNDFVVIDDRDLRCAGLESQLALRLCHRRFGIGADGLLLLREARPSAATDDTSPAFGMVFVNADGLIGEMCGNGARCLAAFIGDAGLAQHALQLDTGAGIVRVRLEARQILLDLPPARALRRDIPIEWEGSTWHFDALDVGVPHAVCFLDSRESLDAAPVVALGRHVRHHPAFAPRGVNVNFIAIDDGMLHLRTYERGVEAETLGCGTGATAAALLAHLRHALPSPLTVVTASGEPVLIRFDAPGDGPDSVHIGSGLLQLAGGAHFVARGEASPELLHNLMRPEAGAA